MQINDLLSRVRIDDLYTRLTGQEFSRVNGALRAKNVFRNDANPSMTLRKKSNTLADYAEGSHYNHFDILRMSGAATSYMDQIQYLANLAGVPVSAEELSSARKDGELRDALRNFRIASVKALEERFSGPAFQRFISDHELPNDIKFFNDVQLGMAPPWNDIKDIPRIKTLIKMPKADYSEFADAGAVIYPLYNVNNSLTSFRMRAIEKKEIRTLKPMEGAIGFYGRSFLQAPKGSGDIIVVEGENNLLSLASIFYGEPDFRSQLSIIATGPATNDNRTMYAISRLGASFYIINDNDPAGEKVVNGFYKYGSDIIQVVNWPKGTPQKYDIEDYLKGKADKLKAYSELGPFLSYPEWVLSRIENIYDREQNEKIKTRKIVEMSSEMLALFKTQLDRDDFAASVKSKFSVDISMHSHNVAVTSEGYKISGNKYVYSDPTDDGAPPVDISTFIFDAKRQLIVTWDDELTVTRELEGEIIRSDGKRFAAHIPVDHLAEFQRLISAMRNAAGYDLIVDRRHVGAFAQVIQELNSPRDVYVFDVVGTPLEDPQKVKEMCGTQHVIIYPEVSVVGKEVVRNSDVNFEVRKAVLTKYLRFGDPDRAEQKKLLKTFFNKMMRGLYGDRPEIWMVMGYSIFSIAKTHISGYPLLNGSTLILHGRTGNMKSTVIRFAQSFWGSYHDEGELGQFIDTGNSQRVILSRFSHLTYSYDEYKPDTHKKVLDLGELIHQIASGRDKMRLNTSAGLREPRSINCSVMMTTEQLPDLSASQNARSIPIRMPEIPKSDTFQQVNEWAFNEQHKITAPMAAWVNQFPVEVREKYEEMYGLMKDGLKKFSNVERLSALYAKCLTGVWILTEFAKRLGVISEERQNEIVDAAIAFSNENKISHADRIEGAAVVDRIVSAISELIQQGTLGVAFMDLDAPTRRWIKPQHQPVDVSCWQTKGVVTIAFHETNMVNQLNRYRPMTGLSVESLRVELYESGLTTSSIAPSSTSYFWPDSISFVKGRVRKIIISEKMPELSMFVLGSFMAKN